MATTPETGAAFNAIAFEGKIAHDGFRIYVSPEGISFLRIGDLNSLTARGQPGDYGGGVSWTALGLASLLSWLWIFLPGRSGKVSGKELLRTMEEVPLEERLHSDPANFVVRGEEILGSVISREEVSFWKRGYGVWKFALADGRRIGMAFHRERDRLVATKNLSDLLGSRQEVLG